MVSSQLELQILIRMLKAEQTRTPLNIKRTTYFHNTMKTLETFGCVESNNVGVRGGKRYRLTVFGRAMAIIQIKHPHTDKEFKKYANKDVEMWVV